MALRRIKRQIAKARLSAMGVGNVNKKMRLKKEDGLQNWKRALYGETGEEAHKVQMNLGKLMKAKKQGRDVVARRKVRKVTA
jgi:hypothetical protein